ncbi:hypothetical protein B0H17DRAFT_1326646 [Mycena rosella]|uniref:Uncharacterized protein n=1 Tax=Mycena rosella TaxID=1033263 RepID=A0AAD7M7L1_MYCRO|nr:hypothetical protein B0H17DRAFT_1326646 [Mycena rosella]
MDTFNEIYTQLNSVPGLCDTIGTEKGMQFIRLAARLKDAIITAREAEVLMAFPKPVRARRISTKLQHQSSDRGAPLVTRAGRKSAAAATMNASARTNTRAQEREVPALTPVAIPAAAPVTTPAPKQQRLKLILPARSVPAHALPALAAVAPSRPTLSRSVPATASFFAPSPAPDTNDPNDDASRTVPADLDRDGRTPRQVSSCVSPEARTVWRRRRWRVRAIADTRVYSQLARACRARRTPANPPAIVRVRQSAGHRARAAVRVPALSARVRLSAACTAVRGLAAALCILPSVPRSLHPMHRVSIPLFSREARSTSGAQLGLGGHAVRYLAAESARVAAIRAAAVPCQQRPD